jgi:predicted nuclease of predicted toxin-antitoxin system
MMRFLVDENVSRLVVERLRNAGHDVISIAETKAGAPDQDVLKTADAEGRILITEDRDFGEMVIRQRLGLHGLMLLELDRLSNATEADTVADVVAAHAYKLAGNLVVIEPGRIRVRPLPS